VDLRGVILSIGTFGRGRQKVTTLRVFDGTGECEVIVPHELLEPPPGLAQGVEIEVSAASPGDEGGRLVLRCDGRSLMKII
jgi:hypothetical protein